MPRNPRDRCDVSWEDRFGTTTSGNLSQYKPDKNLCDINIAAITMPGIILSDFHSYHIKCPYSKEAGQGGIKTYVRDTDPFSPTYMQMILVGINETTTHSATHGVMVKHNHGSKYGHLCVDDNCYYYTTVVPGSRYFYV